MKYNPQMYGHQYDLKTVKDLNDIDEKLKNEKNSDEILRLRTQKLYRGMELFSNITGRNYRGYYPY
jgi:hypothetical protein